MKPLTDTRGDIRNAIAFVKEEDRAELAQPWKDAIDTCDVFNRLYFFGEHLGYVQNGTFLVAVLDAWDALPASVKREHLLKAAGYVDPSEGAFGGDW